MKSITILLLSLLSAVSLFSQSNNTNSSYERTSGMEAEIDTCNILRLDLESNVTATFKVQDLKGNSVSEEQINLVAGNNVILLNYLGSGIYFIRIESDDKSYFNKIQVM